VGLRPGLDTEADGRVLCRDRTPVVQSVVRHYTDRPTPAPKTKYMRLKIHSRPIDNNNDNNQISY
jgi:hypothetical protein